MLKRRPVDPSPLGYPSLSDHGLARRRFLKLAALSSAGLALGLPLSGCPGGEPGSGGGGGGTGLNGGWVPWDGPERLAGEPSLPLGQPVALVVSGGPIQVRFQTGGSAELVVAVVAVPLEGHDVKGDFVRLAEAHTQLVRERAETTPRSVLSDAAALDAFESALFDALATTVQGGYLEELSVAEAKPEPAQVPAREAREEEAADVAREPAAPADAPQQPQEAGPPAPTLAAKRIWVACRRPGCTSCGAR